MSRKGQLSEHSLKLIEMAKRPAGVGSDDLEPGQHPRTIWKLSEAGRLFTRLDGCRSIKRRYFDTRARADAYYAGNPDPKKPEPKPKAIPKEAKAKGTLVRKLAVIGPARLSGDPIITPNTKFTIAPPPPAVLYKSGTFNTAG